VWGWKPQLTGGHSHVSINCVSAHSLYVSNKNKNNNNNNNNKHICGAPEGRKLVYGRDEMLAVY